MGTASDVTRMGTAWSIGRQTSTKFGRTANTPHAPGRRSQNTVRKCQEVDLILVFLGKEIGRVDDTSNVSKSDFFILDGIANSNFLELKWRRHLVENVAAQSIQPRLSL